MTDKKRKMPGIFSLIFVLLILEIVSRFGQSILQDAKDYKNLSADWFQFSREMCWERNPGYSGRVCLTERTFDANGFFDVDAEDLALKEKFRIVLTGDSCTFGFGVKESETFGEILQTKLDNVAVINAAIPGHSSFQGAIATNKFAAELHPDVVIASYEYNDRRYVLNADMQDGSSRFKTVYFANRIMPRIGYFWSFGRSVQGILRTLKDAIHDPKRQADLKNIQPRVPVDRFRDNLLKMVEVARRNDAKLVFLTLGDNSRTKAPVMEALRYLNEGKIDKGIEVLTVVANDPNSIYAVIARRYLVEALNRAGRGAEADDLRFFPRHEFLHGGVPYSMDDEYLEAIRQVAEQNGVLLIDGATALTGHPECFFDTCHLSQAGHRIIADRMGEMLMDLRR